MLFSKLSFVTLIWGALLTSGGLVLLETDLKKLRIAALTAGVLALVACAVFCSLAIAYE